MSNIISEHFKFPKLFTCGASGSGKDTICNYLIDEGYLRLRLAHTIKQIICEKRNLSFDELEVIKRTVAEIRTEHNDLGDFMNETNGTLNRIDLLERFEALDFEYLKQIGWDFKNQPKVYVDVRNYEEANKLFSYGYYGIFLTRQTNEFKNPKHHTEQNMFFNGDLERLIAEQKNNMSIICNNNHILENTDTFDTLVLEKYDSITDVIMCDGTAGDLLEQVKHKFII